MLQVRVRTGDAQQVFRRRPPACSSPNCCIDCPLPARANGFAVNCADASTNTRAALPSGTSTGASTPCLSPVGNAVFRRPSTSAATLNCCHSPFGRHDCRPSSTESSVLWIECGVERAITSNLRRVRLLVLVERQRRAERQDDLLHAEERREARVEQLLVAREARVVVDLENLREAHAREARLRARSARGSCGRSRARRPCSSRCRSPRAACRGRASTSVAFIVASCSFMFTAQANTASDLPFITNSSMRRSSLSVRSLPGCVMMRPSSDSSISAVAVLQVDVVELVEREVARDDLLHRRLAHLRGHEVRLGELHLVVAGEDADLVLDVVALVAKLADLVRDPELEAASSGPARAPG